MDPSVWIMTGLVWLGVSLFACVTWPWRFALVKRVRKAQLAFDRWRVEASGWHEAPPPPLPLEKRESALPILENPVVRGMVIGREKGNALDDRVRVPGINREPPFLSAPQGRAAFTSKGGLSWIGRPLIQKMLGARGRW